jgi:hypothetical protein
MGDRQKFWRAPSDWPRDTEKFVFLGRAVEAIGKAIYLDDWTGEEPWIERVPLMMVAELVYKFSPEIGTAAMEQYDLSELAVSRFQAVQIEIATHAEKNDLVTAWRSKVGGEQQIIPRTWWNTERLQSRFDLCQIDPIDPFATINTGADLCWIFVKRDSLRQFILMRSRQQIARLEGLPEQSAAAMKRSKKQIEDHYLSRITEFEGKTPPSRADDEAFFRELGVKRLRARQLRSQFAPASWQMAGPRSKKPQN